MTIYIYIYIYIYNYIVDMELTDLGNSQFPAAVIIRPMIALVGK